MLDYGGYTCYEPNGCVCSELHTVVVVTNIPAAIVEMVVFIPDFHQSPHYH